MGWSALLIALIFAIHMVKSVQSYAATSSEQLWTPEETAFESSPLRVYRGNDNSSTFSQLLYTTDAYDYTLETLSARNYESFNASLAIYNPSKQCPQCLDACDPLDLHGALEFAHEVERHKVHLTEKVAVLFTALHCDTVTAVLNVVQAVQLLSNTTISSTSQVAAAIELFNPITGDVFNDLVPRFTMNPAVVHAENDNLVVHRIPGRAGGRLLRQVLGCEFPGASIEDTVSDFATCAFHSNSFGARGSYSNTTSVVIELSDHISPWQSMFTDHGIWMIKNCLSLLLYASVAVLSIMSLQKLSENSKRKIHKGIKRGKESNVRHQCFQAVILLAVNRFIGDIITLVRDCFQIWVPDIVGITLWGWGYILLQFSYLHWVLYWRQLLDNQAMHLRGLSTSSLRNMRYFTAFEFTLVTVSLLLFGMRITSHYVTFMFVCNGMLLFTTFGLAVATVIYASKVIKAVNKRLGSTAPAPQVDVQPQQVNAQTEGVSSVGGSIKRRMKRRLGALRPITRLAIIVSIGLIGNIALVMLVFVTPILSQPGPLYLWFFVGLSFLEFLVILGMCYILSPLRMRLMLWRFCKWKQLPSYLSMKHNLGSSQQTSSSDVSVEQQ